jgi:hypothetical protein
LTPPVPPAVRSAGRRRGMVLQSHQGMARRKDPVHPPRSVRDMTRYPSNSVIRKHRKPVALLVQAHWATAGPQRLSMAAANRTDRSMREAMTSPPNARPPDVEPPEGEGVTVMVSAAIRVTLSESVQSALLPAPGRDWSPASKSSAPSVQAQLLATCTLSSAARRPSASLVASSLAQKCTKKVRGCSSSM